MEKERLDIIGESCLGKYHYRGLRKFFEKIWNKSDKYDYCVFLARRCYNLNELFYSACRDVPLSSEKRLSDNALLWLGVKFAQSYLKNNSFPRLLVVDDILIHGRSISFFLHRLEQKIYQELLNAGISEISFHKLYAEFIKSIQIRVYLENHKNILLEENYMWCMKSVESVPSYEWHKFSQGVSMLLVSSDVANTSFIPSTEGMLDWGNDIKNADNMQWKKISWELREQETTFYYKFLPCTPLRYIIFSVRIREPKEILGARWIPFIFTGEPRNNAVQKDIIRLLCQDVESHKFKPLIDILSQETLDNQKAQLIQLILSSVVLYSFCQEVLDLSENELYHLGNICDLEKISRNFSPDNNFKNALKAVFHSEEFIKSCLKLLPKWFYGIPISEKLDEIISKSESPMEIMKINRLMENHMYKEGLYSEQFAYMIKKTGRAYSPTIDNLSPLSLEDLIEKFQHFPICHCLSSLLMSADAGITSLKPQIDSQYHIFQALRAGEQSLFCKPRQLALYIPALILIERRCLSSGKDWVLYRIKQFQDFLKTEDIPFLEEIPELEEFAREWYKTGDILEAWRIPLIYSMDGRKVFFNSDCTYAKYMKKMIDLQNNIWDSCERFLIKNNIDGRFL